MLTTSRSAPSWPQFSPFTAENDARLRQAQCYFPAPKLQRIAPHWDDMLRLSGSLLQGRVPATGIMRTLQVVTNRLDLAKALAEFAWKVDTDTASFNSAEAGI